MRLGIFAAIIILALGCLSVSLSKRIRVFTSPATQVSNRPPQNSSGLEAKIKRVENGLLPSVVFKGRPLIGLNITERMRHHKVPGVSIAVINNNEIEWVRAYGVQEAGGEVPVTTETLFQAASISKPITAVAALRLVQEGKLLLNEDVNLKLASWRIPESDYTREKKVTLRNLLNHSSGLNVHGFNGYAPGVTLPTLLQVLDGVAPANTRPVRVEFTPGSEVRYSGGAYVVLQQLLMDVTGKPFPRLMQETVLGKLGMGHSTFEQPLPQNLRLRAAVGHGFEGEPISGRWNTYPELGAAGLWSTPTDLARFMVEIMKSKLGRSNLVLSRDFVTQMVHSQNEGYGLGIIVEGRARSTRILHSGSNAGFKSFMVAYPETGQGIVVMTNADTGEELLWEVIHGVSREYGWANFHPNERALAQVDPGIYSAFVGQYEVDPQFALKIMTEDRRLFMQPTGQPRFELFPETDTRYFPILSREITITFVRNEQGQVNELILHQGRDLRARRVR